MSNRPRSHQIEDESRIAFESRLPSQWVYRRTQPDYGIDGTVEIFDASGLATGKQFNVQLRATDHARLGKGLNVRFKTERCGYYQKLDLPVLVVRFHASTGKLFAKWFHEFDPFYGKGGKKTVTFRLSELDEWSDKSASQISQALDLIRTIRSGALPFPVPVALKFSGDLAPGLSHAEVSLGVRTAVQAAPGVLSFCQTSAYGSIMVSSREVTVGLAGLKGLVLHFDDTYMRKYAKTALHNDILVAAALTLDSAGYSGPASKLVAQFGKHSTLSGCPEAAFKMSRCMVQSSRIIEAVDFAEALLVDPRLRLTAYAAMLPLLKKSTLMSKTEATAIGHFLEHYICAEEKSGSLAAAAAANYSLGNHLRSRSENRRAFRYYKKAASLDPGYLKRAYFFRELAGVLFILERPRIAAKLYGKAVQLGEQGLARALYADALMFSGDSAEAIRQFELYVAAEAEPKSEFILKSWALPFLCQMLGFTRQNRQQAVARQMSAPGRELRADYAERLNKALALDALCSLAWFNLGRCCIRDGKTDDACVAFLWAALIHPKDSESWANAFALALSSAKHRCLTSHILVAAHFAAGDRFAESVIRLADAQTGEFPRAKYLNAFNEMLAQVPKVEPKFELRLLHKDETWESFL